MKNADIYNEMKGSKIMSDISINNIYTYLNDEGKILSKQEEIKLKSIFKQSDTEDAEGNYVGYGKGDGLLIIMSGIYFNKN